MDSKCIIDRQNNNSIDLFKFIMAFAVIAMHTHPLEYCTNSNLLTLYELLVGMAVPFFFLASGYLLGTKMNWPCTDNMDNTSRIVKQLKRILRMYLIWTVVYLPLSIYHFVSQRVSPIKAIIIYIRGFLFIGEQYNSWPLWYLLSTIYSLAVIYLLFKFKKATNRNMIILCIVASVFSVGFSTLVYFEGELPSVLHTIQKLVVYIIANGRIFEGMVFIPIGMILSKKQLPSFVNHALLFVGLWVSFFINDYTIDSYLRIVTSIAFFEVIASIRLKNRKIYPQLRKISTAVYLTHMYIWTFYYKIVYGAKTYGMDSFLVTSMISILLYCVLDNVKGKRNESVKLK